MIRPGDVVFTFDPNSVISQAIAIFTHTALYKGKEQKISHAEMVIDVGVNGTVQVMSADETGLNPKWVILETLDWYSVKTLFSPVIGDAQRQKLVQWMWDHKGTGYDFLGLADFIPLPVPWTADLSDKHRLFCSSSVFKCYLEAIEVGLLQDVDYWLVDPVKLYTSPLWDFVQGK